MNRLRIYLLSGIGVFMSWTAQGGTPFKLWDRDYGGSKKDSLNVMVEAGDGILLGGSSDSGTSAYKSQPSQGGVDFWIIKVSKEGTKLWDRTYGGSGNDYLAAILPTKDGGFLLGGSSDSQASGDKTESSKGGMDYWIVKVNGNGLKEWDKTVGANKNDFLTTLAYHRDQYVLGGRSQSVRSGDKSESNFADPLYPDSYDYWVLRIDPNTSAVTWDKTIGSDLDDDLQVLFVNPITYDYVLCGTSASGKNIYKTENPKGEDGLGDYWIVKINSSTGARIWDNTIGGTEDEYLFSAVETDGAGFALAGISFSSIGEDNTDGHIGPVVDARSDYWIVKIDADGTKIWDKTFGGLDHDLSRCLIKTKDGGYLIGGWSKSGISGNKSAANKGDYDYWLVKTDKEGTKQWDAAFGGSQNDEMQAILPLDVSKYFGKNGYLLGGSSNSPASGDKTQSTFNNNSLSDYWILQIISFD